MNFVPMVADTSEDAVLGGKLRLRQPLRGHRVGHDAILLAAATGGRAGELAVDLGAGVGAAGLALAVRVEGLKVTLVEIDQALCRGDTVNSREIRVVGDQLDLATAKQTLLVQHFGCKIGALLALLADHALQRHQHADLDRRTLRPCDGKRQEGIRKLLDLIAAEPKAEWRQLALLDGVIGVTPKEGKAAIKPRPVRLDGPSARLAELLKITDQRVATRVAKLDALIVWVGKPGVVVPPPPPPLTAEQQARFEAGKALYQTTCGACHQPTGLGHEGLAPPLVSSEWVDGPPQRIARIVLQGLDGPIKVNGSTYKLEMPPLKVLDDQQLASLITYIRREWDHEAAPVDAALIAKVRTETEKRETVWSAKELLELK